VGVEKVMVTNFWGIHSTIRINCMLCGMTINCSYLRNGVRMPYGSNLMSEAWPAYPTCAARLYTAHSTMTLLHSWRWECVTHPPPYSPDLNFHMFGKLKKHL
jgi:hypothetical protein